MATAEELMDGFGIWYDVEPNTGCWLWLRGTTEKGYAHVRYGGVMNRASRLMLMLHGVEVPSSKFVLHRCDTPACVNPHHLYIGDHADNMRDRAIRGRVAIGSKIAQAKLTEHIVAIIKGMRTSGVSSYAIGDVCGVNATTIQAIWRNLLWRNVNPEVPEKELGSADALRLYLATVEKEMKR